MPENRTTAVVIVSPSILNEYRSSVALSHRHNAVMWDKKTKERVCYKPPESNREPSVLPIELMLQLIVRQKS